MKVSTKNKLWALAERYVEFAKSVNMSQTHNHLRKGDKGNFINLYLSDKFKTWEFTLSNTADNKRYRDSIIATGYLGNISIPYKGMTDKVYNELIDSADKYLNEVLSEAKEEFIQDSLKFKEQKIASLEAELEKLKNG